ncbi:MAG: VOC family protein [Natronomonas sp.]
MSLTPHHIGISVTDLSRAVESYTTLLGISVSDQFSVSGAAFSTVVGVEDAAGEFVHLDAGPIRIELVEYDVEDPPEDSVAFPGNVHLAVETDDVDATFGALPSGVETVSEPQTTASGTRLVFARGPDGTLVEFLES